MCTLKRSSRTSWLASVSLSRVSAPKDRSGARSHTEPASSDESHLLPCLTGLGKGLILDFTKGSFFQDSLHTIDFRGTQGTLKLLLRRRSKLRWNAGLYFRIMVSCAAHTSTRMLFYFASFACFAFICFPLPSYFH
jgi:hypothetical protein